jgi:transcriptional regulator with XRE-family HTH domain
MNLQTYVTDLRSRLRETPVTQREIARLAGPEISFSWVNKFAAGALKNPSIDSLTALERALDQATAAR